MVLVKIVLATLLINHTGELGINSSYYPIYYVPIVTAAIHFGPWGTLLWTSLASAAYCAYLYPALQEYTLTPTGAAELAIRIMFFFMAAIVVNRFTIENRRKTMQYQQVAEELTKPIASSNEPRLRRGVRSGWLRWDSFRPGWRMKFAIRWV